MRRRAANPLSFGNHPCMPAFSREAMLRPFPDAVGQPEDPMTEPDFEAKLAELDQLLNDPEVRMDPDRVWTILSEISGKDGPAPVAVRA
jgi:hypothetical protein